MKKTGSVLLFSLVKAAITISLARHLDRSGAVYLFLGMLLLAANVLLVATRWWLLLRRLNVEALSLGHAMAGTYAPSSSAKRRRGRSAPTPSAAGCATAAESPCG
jgi:uncharacterized membrane protein YbhN (UPF0104 family)